MSLRYITSILSLSASTFLCGADHAGKQFGSPTGIENTSFGSALAAAPESFSAISRQASGYAEEPNTPLGKRDPNRPVSRAGTPCARAQSELLAELDLIFKMERPTAQSDNLDHLTDTQRVGLNHRNKIVVDTIYWMILNDAALVLPHDNMRKGIADTMAQNMHTLLGAHPDIWDNYCSQYKRHIIENSPQVYTSEYGWSRMLDERMSFEKLASFAELAEIRSHNRNGENGRHRFAEDDETPVDPDVILGILKSKIENRRPRSGSSMDRCDSF